MENTKTMNEIQRETIAEVVNAGLGDGSDSYVSFGVVKITENDVGITVNELFRRRLLELYARRYCEDPMVVAALKGEEIDRWTVEADADDFRGYWSGEAVTCPIQS